MNPNSPLSIDNARSDPTAVTADVAPATAFAVTIPQASDLKAEAITLTGSAGTPMTTTGGSVRTTVLPRVEVVENEATLVVDSKRRFELVSRLGAGGVGEVVGVLDHDIGRQVALKRLHADVQSHAALVRFVDEIRTVGSLEHPNIVPIHDVGVDEHGEYYFVMKYIDGETLETVIEKLASGDAAAHRRYTFERRLQIFSSLLEAIAFAHSKGIIHRDIKPANVMVGRYGEVVMMDWGIAKSLRGPDMTALSRPEDAPAEPAASDAHSPQRLFKTQVGQLIGTPAYMSPEQVRGEEVDERSDIYSLCVLFHEFFSLKHYLASKTTMADMFAGVLFDEAPPLSRAESPHQPPPPADLMRFVERGLMKDKKDRYPSVAVMLERLELRAAGKIEVCCPVTFTMRVTGELSRFAQRHPTLFLSTSASFLAVFFLGFVYLVIT